MIMYKWDEEYVAIKYGYGEINIRIKKFFAVRVNYKKLKKKNLSG